MHALQNLINLRKVPYLFACLCFALVALVAFQLSWINMSKRLIEEQFDQKVNLAIGSALADYNVNHKTSLQIDEFQDCGDENLKYLPIEKGQFGAADQMELEDNLSNYMACYGIDDKYSIEIFDDACKPSNASYCCSLGPLTGCNDDYMMGVSFLSREQYLFDQMMPMIISSILIFILLATVSFILLWSLLKQKRITENNIDFFNNTAHELKTPLTNISLALKLLGMKHENIKDDKYAQIIKAENTKLTDQIERVLFLSKMENGEYAMKNEVLNINEILKEVVEHMSLLKDEKNATINLSLPNQKINVIGDYYHISNAFRNLIDNALKYSDKAPVINITLEEGQDKVNVIFKDNGIGIDKKDQSHIFEKFQRVNTGDIKRANGFGIGLSYVKTVIELHKGLVMVESELHKGSKFQLSIPNA